MEYHAGHDRVAHLEAELPRLRGQERLQSLAELAWHLRERDTRRAQSLASEAASLIGHDGSSEAARVAPRVHLTLAECALLFRETDAALGAADRALQGFEAIEDAAGIVDARLMRARMAWLCGDAASACTGLEEAKRASEATSDPLRQALATAALESLDLAAQSTAPHAAVPPAAGLRFAYLDAQRRLRQGDFEAVVEALARIGIEAPAHGMDELALESELAMARIAGAFQDFGAALEWAEPVLAQARSRGWRGLLASATASVCEWLLKTGQSPRAIDLLTEARASAAGASAAVEAPAIERLLGEAQLATGHATAAAEAFARAAALLETRGQPADMAHVMAAQARTLAAQGDAGDATDMAMRALRTARAARSRPAEMDALDALGELHAEHAGAGRTARAAVAFLRHAAEIAGELDDAPRRSELLRRVADLHEAAGDAASALAAHKAAHAESDRAIRRRTSDLTRAARARWARERASVEHTAAVTSHRAGEDHARELQQAYAAADRMRSAAEHIMASPDAATLAERIDAHLRGVVTADHLALFVFDAAGQRLSRYAREAGRAIPVREVAAADLESYAARTARERRELLVELETARAGEAQAARDRATLWFGPIESDAEVLGVLTVQSRRTHAFAEADKIAFRALCADAAAALRRMALLDALEAQRTSRIDAEERLRRLATVDALTGLATRAHFLSIGRERLERARRGGGPCGLIVADVDAFRRINDIHGHRAGDRVLAGVASTLAQHLHGDDVAGRVGGEEFALLLPGATLEATVAIAERMRLAVETRAPAHDGRPLMVTMSFGCTAVADAARDLPDKPAASILEGLLREADAALCEAQGTGGNRSIAWPAYQALRALRLGPSGRADSQSLA